RSLAGGHDADDEGDDRRHRHDLAHDRDREDALQRQLDEVERQTPDGIKDRARELARPAAVGEAGLGRVDEEEGPVTLREEVAAHRAHLRERRDLEGEAKLLVGAVGVALPEEAHAAVRDEAGEVLAGAVAALDAQRAPSAPLREEENEADREEPQRMRHAYGE